MRRKWKLSAVGPLGLAMVLALGVVGVSYAAWIDTVTIDTTVHVGRWTVVLTPGTCSTDPPGGTLSCTASGNTLQISLTPQAGTFYYCPFTANNNGSIPVKAIVESGLPPGAGCDITPTQIDPGETRVGAVIIYNTGSGGPITVNIVFVPWNKK